MGGRGSASGGAGKGNSSPIGTGSRDVIREKTGKSFQALPQRYQDSINAGLKMSDAMKSDISNGRRHQMQDEWTTKIGSEKRTVITDVVDGKTVYTIKRRNKILERGLTKEQAANGIAKFYISEAKKMGKELI